MKGSNTNTYELCYSLQDLKRHAVLFYLGKDPDSKSEVDLGKYKVSFVHTDTDGDKALIRCDRDLTNFLILAPKRSRKVFAEVQQEAPLVEAVIRETSAESATPTTNPANSSTQTVPENGASSSPTPTAYRGNKALKQLQDTAVALEEVAGQLAAAAASVIALSDHVQEQHTTDQIPSRTTGVPYFTASAPRVLCHHTCHGCLATPLVGTRSSDAVLRETLGKVARVIDGINLKLDMKTPSAEHMEQEFSVESINVEASQDEEQSSTTSQSLGYGKDDTISHESWKMVNDDI
jgi:hypothetical protein